MNAFELWKTAPVHFEVVIYIIDSVYDAKSNLFGTLIVLATRTITHQRLSTIYSGID